LRLLFLGGAAILIGTGGLLAFFGSSSAVTVALPTKGTAAEVVYATGIVEPVQWAKVTPLMRQRIVELCRCEGKGVKKGEVLGRLDDAEALALLEQLRSRETLAKTEYERTAGLAAKGVSTQRTMDQVSHELKQAQDAVSGQSAKMEEFVLRAPMDGVVLRRDGEIGEVAEPGAVLFWVGQPAPLEVVADVNEEDILRVNLGMAVIIHADAYPNGDVDGMLVHITPKGDSVAKTYRVRIRLAEHSPLMVGMTVEANIVVRREADALLIPRASVTDNRVWLVENGRASPRPVTIGIRGTERVQVLSGIDLNTWIISPVLGGLTVGQRVQIKSGGSVEASP
jgi:membrane fusion protein, multidrug efflux system